MTKKILVIDDEASALRFAQYTLDRNNYKVLTARDGLEGLTVAKSELPDLIVLDVAMPRMVGFEVLSQLKIDPDLVDIPVVMLTAMSAAKGESLGMELGVHHYVSKPCNPEDLALSVKVALRSLEPSEDYNRTENFQLGNSALDIELGGGIPPGAVALFEGASSSGKSVLCQHYSYAALTTWSRVAYFTFGNSEESLTNQMKSIGLEVGYYLRSGAMRIIPLEEPYEATEIEALQPLSLLAEEINQLPQECHLIIVDALTHLASCSSERSILSFLRACKQIANRGKTIILIIHTSSFEERTLVRLRALCDVHFRLSVEKFGLRLLKTLEVCKVHNAELDTGKIVNFDVKPGFGIQISPMNRATV